MRIPSGTVDQYLYFVAVDSTDLKTRETGLSSFTVYRSRNGAAAVAMTTPTVNEVDATNMPGLFELLMDEDMTIASGNDSEEYAVHITHAGMAPVTRVFELYRPKITLGETLDVTSGAVDDVTLVATTTTNSDMVGTNNAALATALATAQTDLDTLTGSDGVVLATSQPNYAPNTIAPDNTGISDISGVLADVETDVTAILADTAELQTNQGNWLTATGFSTHSAADVRSEIDTNSTQLSLILGDTAELQTNQGNWLTATGFSTHSAADVRSEIDTNSTQLSLILGDTAELQTNQGNWLTATGFSTHSAADVRSEIDTNSTQLSLILGDMAELQTNQGNWLTATGFSTHSAADVRSEIDTNSTQLSLILGDTAELQTNQGNWLTATGFSTHSAADVRSEIDTNSTELALILADTAELQTNQGNWLTATGFSTHSTSDILTQVQTAIENNHLDHLLAADFDPASKPGVATALLNELIESDGGVSRFTANALEQGPSGGGGGDATEAKQDSLIATLATVLADTNELQTNQGNWLTATGFSTHSAADVRSEIDTNSTQLSLILADTNELQTNQGNWLTATGFSTHSAADVRSEIDTNSTQLSLILGDTAELQTNQGNWLTATGFSTHSAADVRSEIDTNSTELALILADTAELQTNQGNWLTATGFSTHSAADVRSEIDTNSTQLSLILADTAELQTNQGNWLTASDSDISAAVLTLDVADVEDTAGLTLDTLAGFLLRIGHSSRTATVETVTKTDDVTPFGTKSIGTDSSAPGVTSVQDP